MTNSDISTVFRAIGGLLQIRGDDAFRARIYERAADRIDELTGELDVSNQNIRNDEKTPKMHVAYGRNTPQNIITIEQFRAIPGIGKAIVDKTVEMLETGRCRFYDELTTEMGTEVLELLAIRGIGVKTAGRFYRELDIRNMEDLQVALNSGQLKGMKGIGRKTLQMIAEGLQFHMTQKGTRPLWRILPIVQQISDILAQFATQSTTAAPIDELSKRAIKRYEFTGDFRRHEEVCHSLELVVECSGERDMLRESLLERLSQTKLLCERFETPMTPSFEHSQSELYLPLLCRGNILKATREEAHTASAIQFSVDRDFPVSIYLCTAAEYEATLFLTTATDEHLAALRDSSDSEETGGREAQSEAKMFTLPVLSQKSKSHQESNDQSPSRSEFIHGNTETEIYQKLGLPYIPPELRQDADAVTAAREGRLPSLVEFGDMRGDLHAHTDWSDGRNTLRDMVEAAKALGLEYFAITDHSVSSTVANGLDKQRLLEQVKQVRELDADIEGITLLAGSEVDIRKDGRLDFPEEILAQLDIVVASVHSHFSLTEAEMTRRMIRAIENPFVKIIGHPTGRLLGRRPMYPLNVDEIIEAAAENNTVLEINGSPSRLDLGPEFVRKAKRAGVRLAVNTDAHAIAQLAHRQYGVNVARRGGLTKADVINTYPLEKLRDMWEGFVTPTPHY